MHGHSCMYPLGSLLAKECTIEWANTAPLITCKLDGGEGLGWTLKSSDSHKNDHYFQKDSNYNDFEFLKGPINYLLPPYNHFIECICHLLAFTSGQDGGHSRCF